VRYYLFLSQVLLISFLGNCNKHTQKTENNELGNIGELVKKNEKLISNQRKNSKSYQNPKQLSKNKNPKIPKTAIWAPTTGFFGCCFYEGEKDENDLPNGRWTAYYVNGSIHMEMNYKHGLLDGKMTGFHETSEKMIEGYWTEGVRKGKWRFWSYDKKLWKEGFYRNNKMNGTWFIHEKNKKLKCLYENEVRKKCTASD